MDDPYLTAQGYVGNCIRAVTGSCASMIPNRGKLGSITEGSEIFSAKKNMRSRQYPLQQAEKAQNGRKWGQTAAFCSILVSLSKNGSQYFQTTNVVSRSLSGQAWRESVIRGVPAETEDAELLALEGSVLSIQASLADDRKRCQSREALHRNVEFFRN